MSNTLDLPILDLKPLIENDSEGLKALLITAEKSLKDIGFFVVKNHGIPEQYIKDTFKISKEFFDCNDSVKASVKMTAEYPYGYEKAEILSQGFTGEGIQPDLKETYNIKVSEPVWPTQPQYFTSVVDNYCKEIWSVARHILKLFALILEEDQTFFDEKFPKDNMTVLRQLNYPAVEQGSARTRASAHTDYGVLTILAQDSVGGLQVSLKDGEWEDVSTPPGCLVVNIGDMMQRWSNDGWRSTLHRVVVRESGPSPRRQSMAFFVNPGQNTMIECIPKYIPEGQEAKYPPIRALDYILAKHYSTLPRLKEEREEKS